MDRDGSHAHPSLFASRADPDRLAASSLETAITFGGLERAAGAWARRLEARGLRPGDRVAISGPSGLAIAVAVTGHLRGGYVHVPVSDRYRRGELEHIFSDSGAAAVVAPAGSEAMATARSLGVPAFDLAEVPAADPGGGDPWRAPPPPPAAPALLVYTSGTTGRSKGVLTSHGALVANLHAITSLWRWTSKDVLALCLPLFHVHGLGLGLLGGMLLRRLTVLLLPRFDPAALADAFAERGASIFMGVPTMYRRLLGWLDDHPERAADFARGRLFTSGSAALPAADLEAFAARTGHRILERYGMTETGFTLSNPYDGERRAGTVGLPVPGCTVRILDEAGREVPAGASGELHVRGGAMMDGYWGQPEVTAQAFRGGWFATGDVVVREADGYLRVVGRSSVDIIKSGGFKLSAREIEEVLLTHPAVAEAAVIGVPDPVWGERVAAAIVLGAAGTRDEEDLLAELAAHVGDHLADYKRPRQLAILPELPRNALGKVQKHRLRGSLPP